MVATRVIIVELMTRNKALPGDSPDYHLFIYFFISLSMKSKGTFEDIFVLRVFSVANLSRGRSRRMMDKQHYEHESYADYNTSICLDGGTTTEGDLNSIHLKF